MIWSTVHNEKMYKEGKKMDKRGPDPPPICPNTDTQRPRPRWRKTWKVFISRSKNEGHGIWISRGE